MNYYDKSENAIIAVDFDGTISRRPYERSPLDEPPQDGFVEFYKNITTKYKGEMIIALHTSRYLVGDNDYWATRKYLERWGLTEIYFPKRDGHTFKNIEGDTYTSRTYFGVNTKIPCFLVIDDINVGCPKLPNGELDWNKIYNTVVEEYEKCKEYWRNKDV